MVSNEVVLGYDETDGVLLVFFKVEEGSGSGIGFFLALKMGVWFVEVQGFCESNDGEKEEVEVSHLQEV